MQGRINTRVSKGVGKQRFWVVDDPEVIAAVQAEMAPKRNLIIADGHHRYETALTIQDEMRAAYPDSPAHASFNYRMVMMVSISDPGLVILPTHRLIHSFNGKSSKAVLEDSKRYFDVMQVSNRSMMEAMLADASPDRPRIGFYDGNYAVFTLRDSSAMQPLSPNKGNGRTLDVRVLHNLLIEGVMGLSQESVARKENVDYLREPDMGFKKVDKGEANFLFILNPTRMEQVRDSAMAGVMMPQKSTDFYPKIVSGFVAMPIGLGEEL